RRVHPLRMAGIRSGNGCRDGLGPSRGAFPPRRSSLRSGAQEGVETVSLRTPYLLFIGDAPDQLAAKTAAGIAFWRPEISLGQLRLPGCNADLGIPDMTIEEAAAAGVKTVIVGTTIAAAFSAKAGRGCSCRRL